MIDIHTHILPSVDDGPKNYKQALEIIKESSKQGIKKMVATPHYLEKGFQLYPEETEKKVAELQDRINKEGINMEIFPGAEVHINPDIGKKLKNGLVSTVNHSHYILIEFPFAYIPDYVDNVFYDLKIMGYTPIICHPERYSEIIKHPNILYNWIQEGMLAQVNASSLIGAFGKEVKETAIKLVNHNLIQFIGSDVHSTKNRKQYLKRAVKLLEDSDIDTEYFFNNAEQILKDNKVKKLIPVKYKPDSFLDKIKKLF